MNKLTHKSCLIIGLGQTGLSCARFLADRALSVAVMDTREQPPALTTLQQDYPQVLIKTGALELDWMLKADLIILSPGVDPRLPEIRAAREAGIEMVGDIELFARYADAPVVAITGSNGKSTVTTLLALMAQLAGKNTRTGGNLGTPALDLLEETAPDFYILELSSFQLETVCSLNAFAAVVLNVSPDHLDRYDSVEDYQRAKQKIFNGDGVMVINRDDPIVSAMADGSRIQIGFSLHQTEGVDFGLLQKDGETWLAEGNEPLLAASQMKMVGTHNLANALAALALGSAMALPMSAMLTALQAFKGLPHRCRLVRELDGVRWFNDSKATNIGACVAAIEGLAGNGPIVLIAGGVGKDQNFSELTRTLKKAVRAVVLMGEDADKIAAIVPPGVETRLAVDLNDAVSQARQAAQQGDSVLLSPACASFDMFSGYVERGDKFEQAVRGLAA
ncbi:UDP-N-acetylmuramoyl-L-alanine--D-glutamate ligase [Methylophaga sp. OBS1]|uniref:UDP-N-acetylmuramoyl-L-alanine--D-glutamate ligase n=1 Tax=Methylophaga sp. OBS1 TaxID=2991933 RepID=UPI00225B6C08|nr:UDP-N-acetylmuramoyl-L-alanine--D-glutamate ligase [Methylophaga sp. OBS1]MCX4193447.1 UDP-N-acetylmuramoyl-L-alanine--D-glutamate ligase [Methylophaga sp. OBS1]